MIAFQDRTYTLIIGFGGLGVLFVGDVQNGHGGVDLITPRQGGGNQKTYADTYSRTKLFRPS